MSLMARQRLAITGAANAGPVFDSPINITDALIASNGSNVFEGNLENTSYTANNGAAVYVTTTQPVIIQNSRLKGQQYCVSSMANPNNVTVRNCVCLVRNTTSAGYPASRALNFENQNNTTLENNTLIGGGIMLTAVPSIGASAYTRVRYNRIINIDGRMSDGAGGYVYERLAVSPYFSNKCALQINVGSFTDAEIAWNEVVNTPYGSRIEDSFNITSAVGTVSKPVNIHDNCIMGGWNTRPHEIKFTGGGFIIEGTTQYVNIDDNQVIGYSNVGIGIASGSNINVRRNRLVSVGSVNGRAIFSRNRAAYSSSASSEYIVIEDTGYSWLDAGGAQSGWWIPYPDNTGSAHTGDYSLGASTTAATEQAERDYWKAKVRAAGVTIGSTLAHW